MDEYNDFFNFKNPPSSSGMTKLRGPLTGGRGVSSEDVIGQMNRKEGHRKAALRTGTDYAKEIKERENEMYLRNESERDKWESIAGGLESLEQLSTTGMSMMNIQELTDDAMKEVYSKYNFQKKEDNYRLAITDYRQQILDRITAFPVVIVEGPTGCGKTTQVPQWILDDCYQKRKPCKIIVTQPRRIAAISIAKRVAQERGCDVGGLIGYQVGLENRTSSDTRVHYCTTGVLLQKLVAAKTMDEYTHIILDEVHERGQEMDFLLLVVKKLLYTVSPKVKVVLMSATFNQKDFADYFVIPTPRGSLMSPCINVANRDHMFTVKVFYLDEINKFGSLNLDADPKEEPTIKPEMNHLVLRLLNAFEIIDEREENYDDRDEADLPSVLIFLPGINEIEELYEILTNVVTRQKTVGPECARFKWWVLPLHSTITADEQARVFQRAPKGFRKIILATNIAESSITVPDIKYVIDFCLLKVLVADTNTNFTSLQLQWASKTNCEQRAGRAGRVREGRVYRLVMKKFYEQLPNECPPEIIRCPLERLVLLAKTLDMGPPASILALAMNPPDISNIYRTVLVLKEIGALRKTLHGEWSDADGDITYLGRIMAKLPLDVRVSKLIMLGYIYGVLDDCVIMGAGMSVKNVFSNPFRERLNAYNSKLTWSDGSTSDCIAILNVYKVWSHLRQQGHFKQHAEVQWARRSYVQLRALRELDQLIRELNIRLSREGIDSSAATSPWSKSETQLALKVVMAGAFYPQYFVQLSQDEMREREALKLLAGRDPRNTVYLKDFPFNQPGKIYAPLIKNIIKQQIGDEPRVSFDGNSQKVYLTFDADVSSKRDNGDPTIPGQVVLPVYKALKISQLRVDIRIPLLSQDRAEQLAKVLSSSREDIDLETKVPRLPEIQDSHIVITISQFVSVSRFWVQYDHDSTKEELRKIQEKLNNGRLLAYTGSITPGDILVAPYSDGVQYRVRVLKVLPRDMLEVLYVDYGSYGRVSISNVRCLPAGICQNTPPLAMQCRLAGIAPAPLQDTHGGWSPRATQFFTDLIARTRGTKYGKIYSVVNGVVAIELLISDDRLNVNKRLVDEGFAIAFEESYESRLNHHIRETAKMLSPTQINKYNEEQMKQAFTEHREIDPISTKDCVSDVCLKGPFSPLESKVRSLMYASREKEVSIERTSINSVLLDTDPQDIYERLLVAADVGQNEFSSKLTLRHTTLMPNIHGLPAIMALLFCPLAELRRNLVGTHYVSALCGLGSHDSGAPCFPEHDLLVSVDIELDDADIARINHIRHLMDYMMFCSDGQDAPNLEDVFRKQAPSKIRNNLLETLKKRRRHVDAQSVPNEWEWRSVPESQLLEISEPDMVDRAVIYPLHTPHEMNTLSREQILELKAHNDELYKMIDGVNTSTGREMSCKLCGTAMMPVHSMRIHLYSNQHREKEEEYALSSEITY